MEVRPVASLLMVARIDGAGSPPPLAGIAVGGWASASPRELHHVMERAYARGGGVVAPFDEWYPWFSGDPEFDPTTCFVAHSADGVSGVCLCWSSVFVKDLCVHPDAQRRGVGEHLLRTAMATFAFRGEREIALKVESGNARAIRLYERCGFRPSPAPTGPAVPGTDPRSH